MNVKFKMPKFGRKLTDGSMVKELLLTILGTTISIVLTFGTAHLIEQRQAEQNQRLLAMTIISDIAEHINIVKALLEAEENGHNVTVYLMDHMDRLDSISDDTLKVFFDYVTPSSFTQDGQLMKSSENYLNMSQDSWRTLSDKKFLENVRAFYVYKALIDRQQKEQVAFQKPVTSEELYQMLMESDEMSTREGYVATCRKLLNSIRVKRYTDYSAQRVYDIQYFMLCSIDLNEENKFLMNITEQDMQDFANGTHMKVRPAKESELIGTWRTAGSNDNSWSACELNTDHTFTNNYVDYWGDVAFSGKMVRRYSISGTWTVEGDSIVKVFDMKSYKMEIDENGAVYEPNKAGIVAKLKNKHAEMPGHLKSLEPNPRISQATNLDDSGTRLQLNDPAMGGCVHLWKTK